MQSNSPFVQIKASIMYGIIVQVERGQGNMLQTGKSVKTEKMTVTQGNFTSLFKSSALHAEKCSAENIFQSK